MTADLKLEVGFSAGPYDTSITWTNITSRLRGFDMNRGRKKATDGYQPGRITAVLDNSDRLLDYKYSAALNYLAGNKGRPLSPVRVTIDKGGSNYPLFYGFLGPECWQATPQSVGTESTVTMNAFDVMGLYVRRELHRNNVWGYIAGYLDPTWWMDGSADFPALSNSSTVPNMMPSGGDAVVSGVTTGNFPYLGQRSGSNPYGWNNGDPVLRMALGNKLTAAADDIMDGADQDNTTDMVFWAGDEQASDQTIMQAVSPGGSTKRWEVICDSAGALKLHVYNSGGTLLSTATAPSNPADGGGRWDTLAPIHIIVRHTGGSESKLYAAGETATTGSAIAEVLESDIVLGSSPGVHYFWDHMHWNRALSDAEISVPTIYIGTGLGPWRADTLTQRIGHLFDAYGLPDNSTVHIGSSDGSYSVGMYEITTPYTNLSAALQATAFDWGGAAWADKSGGVRVRSITAPENATHATHYSTITANFTDEASPAGSPQPLRRPPVTFSGIDGDAVINQFKVSFRHGGELGSFDTPTTAQLSKTSTDSVDHYGRKVSQITTAVGEWEWAALLAGKLVTRYANPVDTMDDLVLQPWGDDDLTDWVVEEAELERAVRVTYTPPSAGSATTVDLNILGIGWSWSRGTDWTVRLSLGEL